MATSYTYRSLDPKRQDIRLLKVLPDKAGSPVRIIIEHASLDGGQMPPYETVSYAWGDSARIDYLRVYESARARAGLALARLGLHVPFRKPYLDLKVPMNTEAALKQIRLTDKVRRIWIDAVCINQDDFSERGQQVGIMSRIFRQSAGNLICLGALDASMADRVSHTIAALLNDANRSTQSVSDLYSSLAGGKFQILRQSDSPLLVSAPRDVMEAVLGCAWWQRLWVVQEAASAPSNTVLLGMLHIKLLDLVHALMWWNYHYLSARESELSFEAEAGRQSLTMTSQIITLDHETHRGLSFSEVLMMATCLKKTEGRDGVFAVQSLAKPIPEAAAFPMETDYSRPLHDVLHEATRNMTSDSHDLCWMRSVHLRPGDLEDDAHVASWALRPDRCLDYRVDASELPGIYEAFTVVSPVTYTFTPDSCELLVGGYVVDRIMRQTRLFPGVDALVPWFLDAVSVQFGSVYSPTNLPGIRAIARTLVVNATREATRIFDEDDPHGAAPSVQDNGTLEHRGYLSPLEDFLQLLLSAVHVHLPLIGACIQGPNGKPAYLTEAQHVIWLKYDFGYLDHRRVFATDSGRLGLGPREMQPGDVVAGILGADLPCILRPLENGLSRFIGCAYVDGIMDGQWMDECKTRGDEEAVFTLI